MGSTSTLKKALAGTGFLIAGYLILVNFTGFTKDVGAVSTASTSVIGKLQGRS